MEIKLRKIVKRKSGFEDSFFVMVFLFALAIFIVILFKAWSEIKTPLDEGLSASMPSDGVNITKVLDDTTGTLGMFDTLYPFLLVGLIGFVLIIGSIYANHPIYLFIGILILGVAILLAVVYSNVYNTITETDEFSSTKTEFGIIDKFLEYLPYIVFIMFIAIATAIIWARKGGGSGGL